MELNEYRKMYLTERKFWWFVGMRNINFKLIERFLKTKKENKILDAGCGTGINLVYLKKYGNVYGIDASPEAIKFCNKRDLNNINLGTIEELPYDDNTFDLVTSFDVIYHKAVKDDFNALKEMYRVCKKNGLVLIQVASYNSLYSKHDQAVHTKRRYTKKELAKKVKAAGFKIRKITYANTFLFPLVALSRLVENVLNMEKEESEIKPINLFLNKALTKILVLESKLLQNINLPFGLSVICLAEKK